MQPLWTESIPRYRSALDLMGDNDYCSSPVCKAACGYHYVMESDTLFLFSLLSEPLSLIKTADQPAELL